MLWLGSEVPSVASQALYRGGGSGLCDLLTARDFLVN